MGKAASAALVLAAAGAVCDCIAGALFAGADDCALEDCWAIALPISTTPAAITGTTDSILSILALLHAEAYPPNSRLPVSQVLCTFHEVR